MPGAGGRVFQPGYILHSAVHKSRPDCHAVWHCHPIETTALCQTQTQLLPISQEALLALKKGISVHPFEGSANDVDEQPRLLANLGPTNQIVLLANHGPMVLGSDLKEAFSTMWFLTRACQYQVQAMAAVGGDLARLNLPDNAKRQEMEQRAQNFDSAGPTATATTTATERHEFDTAALMWDCARREAERHFGADTIYC